MPWQFIELPADFWTDQGKRDRFFTVLARQRKWKRFAPFFALTAADLDAAGVDSLLALFQSRHVLEPLKATYSAFAWPPWRFGLGPRGEWAEPPNRAQLLD